MTQKEMLKKYPELFGTDFDPRKTLMGFGFEVGPGWLKIIEKYLPELSEVVKENYLSDFRVVQVKEKFGSLRFYTNYSTDATDKVIEKMEEECDKTCERCGAPGTLRTDGWWQVLCDKCNAEIKGNK